MTTFQICPPHLSDVATLPLGHFSTLLFIYIRLFMLPRKKTNSNCCTADLADLLLFSASYYLCSPSTASGTRQEERVYWYGHVWRLAAAASCGIGWISAQRGELCDWSVSEKTENLYECRRWSLWTLAVTLLAWHSSCHTSQPVFSEPPMTTHNWLSSVLERLKERNKPSDRWKSFTS